MEERWSSLLALLVYVYSLISDQLVITIIINVLWGLKTCPSLEPIHQINPSESIVGLSSPIAAYMRAHIKAYFSFG